MSSTMSTKKLWRSRTGSQIYYPAMQQGPSGAQLVIRTSLPPAPRLPQASLRALRELNPKQPAAEFQPIRTIVDRAVSPRRFFMLLVAGFAGLGLLLAALGIYGVISYSVTQRTHEIGIRMALGATTAEVQLRVIGKTLRLTLIGIAAGSIASLVVARAIAALLFGTTPTDPVTFAAVITASQWWHPSPAIFQLEKASHIDPMVALRNH